MLLEADSIHSGYGATDVLHGVSFDVAEGEIVSLIGPNGAGKSTVMKTVYGFLKPRKGSVKFDGRDIAGRRPHELISLGMSFVHQGRQVFRTMTVRDNLEMGAFSDNAALKNIKNVYKMFPVLRKKQDQYASELSGGQQQQLAIARALMTEPELLMLDEPSLGLDPKTVSIVFDKIEEINDSGTTVLLVEQNAHMALAISDRAFVIDRGRVALRGSGKKLARMKKVKKLYLGG